MIYFSSAISNYKPVLYILITFSSGGVFYISLEQHFIIIKIAEGLRVIRKHRSKYDDEIHF